MAVCLLSVGSNLGERRQTLDAALARLSEDARFRQVTASRWHTTQPVGGPGGQTAFLNGAIRCETDLKPAELLAALQTLEQEFGRQRGTRWAARTLDVDLLLYGQKSIATEELTVPHPRLSFRRFVLEPAAEIAADMPVPGLGCSIGQLLEHLNFADSYVAVTGPIGVGKSRLAAAVSQTSNARYLREPVDDARLAEFYANPTGQAWETEITFLRHRVALLRRSEGCALAAPDSVAAPPQQVISDFWFDQSLAFARVWLPHDQLRRYTARWQKAREQNSLLQPKLVVVLDAPSSVLLERIGQRGRPYEQQLTPAVLDELREGLNEVLEELRPGPVLRLDARAGETNHDEVVAALSAMQ